MTTPVTRFSDRARAGMGETFARRAGTSLAHLVRGLTVELEATDDLASPFLDDSDVLQQWPLVSDLDSSPFTAWLGQVAGVQVPAGLALVDQRAYVLDAPYRRRGTVGAMALAVQGVLSGSKRVQILERVGLDPYLLAIRVHADDATGTTTGAIAAAAATQKPVGLTIDHVELAATGTDAASYATWWKADSVRYARLTAKRTTYPVFTTAYPTYDAARDAHRAAEA